GRPQSLINRVPTSLYRSACSLACSRVVGPSAPISGWQCASTRPGTRNAPSNVRAPSTGSNVIRPSSIQTSRSTPSGSTTPRRWYMAPSPAYFFFFFGRFSFDGSKPGGSSFNPPPSWDRSGMPPPCGNPPGKPPGKPPLTLGGVGPLCLAFFPFLPLRFFVALTPAPNPNRPAICCIILRASKDRVTRACAPRTAPPEP